MRTAIVTGASRGLGRAFAVGLAKDGFALSIAARNAAELEETAQELRTELQARQGDRAQLEHEEAKARRKTNPNVTPEQEEELKHFPEYWANSKGSWSNLFKLLRELRAEMREGKGNA